MSKLTDRIRAANAEGRTALVPFLPAGYPDPERFWTEMRAMDEVADVIEIGMPFSDPVADGPVVEAASLKALEQGASVAWILRELKAREPFAAGLVLMGYLNPVLQYGPARFAEDAAAAGVNGVILADVPFEEAGDIRRELAAHGVDLIPLVGLNTSAARMRLYAESATGFAYFVSVLGTTGQRDDLPAEVREGLTTAREVFDIPMALGFGLKRPEQLEKLDGLVDAAVIGSAIIAHIDDGGDAASFLAGWR